MAACTDDIVDNGGGEGMPEGEQKSVVCLSAGAEQMMPTRAGNISYMPNHVRFSAMMLIHEEPGEYKYEHPFFANMIVDNAGAGNSWYYKSDYKTPEHYDSYNNDDDANAFYWQNRLSHGFVGYIDDYNKALPWAKHEAGDPEYSSLTVPYFPKTISDWNPTGPGIGDVGDKKVDKDNTLPILYTLKKDGTILRWQQYQKFDLRRKAVGETKMSEQKDPLVAYTEKIPESSSPEKNRVYLTFRHQFAQVQVNLRGSKTSANINKEDIERVELLGVSEHAYVFPYPEYGCVNDTTFVLDEGHKVDDGNGNPKIDHVETLWTIARQGKDRTELLRPALAEKVDLTKYTEEHLKYNEFGTSFQLFDMAESDVMEGYIKGYEGIAYGNLGALRIVWHEDVHNSENDVVHDIVFKITDDKFKVLESGKRYIFNLELRRGTLAVIKAVIDDWIPYETEYITDGTVVKQGK